MIEILSPGTRKVDERTKRDLYDRVGVREYWIVDPKGASIAVYRRTNDGGFPMVARPTADERGVLTTPLLPKFSLAVAEFFAR